MSPIKLEMHYKSYKAFQITILDANGDPVVITGKTLRFVVANTQNPPTGKFDVENASITKVNNVATVPVLVAQSTAAGIDRDLYWWLWSLNDPTSGEAQVLAEGPFVIAPAVENV